MAQNIYDSPTFFQGYSRLPRSVLGLDGAPEWPELQGMLPDLNGARIVDLGCGFGWFARWVRTQGAARILALDLSDNMLARAREETNDGAIEYVRADLETLALLPQSFDLAYSSLAFHYIADFPRLLATLFEAIVPTGWLVFSIEHPIYMAPETPNWQVAADGRRYWPLRRYAVEGRRTTDWLAPGVVKQHRTIGTTLNALIDAGFTVRRVREWRPTDQQIATQPALADELERPMLLLVAASR